MLHALGSGSRAPHPARRQRVRLVQLASTSGDGVAVQARDARQQRDPPVAVQSGEEADDEPPAAFVGTSDDPVDRLVLTSDGPVRFPTALGAGAAMDRRDILLCESCTSVPYLPDQSDRAVRSLYSKC